MFYGVLSWLRSYLSDFDRYFRKRNFVFSVGGISFGRGRKRNGRYAADDGEVLFHRAVAVPKQVQKRKTDASSRVPFDQADQRSTAEAKPFNDMGLRPIGTSGTEVQGSSVCFRVKRN